MRIQEIIQIFDNEKKYVTSISKSIPGLCILILPYIQAMSDDLESAVYQTMLYKTLIDKINFSELQKDDTVNNFINLVEKNYAIYNKEVPAHMKKLKLLLDQYTFDIRYNMSEFSKMEDYDVKLFNSYISDGSSSVLNYSYPLVQEILPFVYNDVLTVNKLNESILLGDFALKLIGELKKKEELTKRSNYIANMITSEYLDTEEFLEENIPSYDEYKMVLLSDVTYKVEDQPTIYNNPTLLSNYIFEVFLGNKDRLFFDYLNSLFKKYSSNDGTYDYNSIINDLRFRLFKNEYINLSKCITNIINQNNAEALVNLLYMKLYSIYGTEEYNKLFKDSDDNSRGSR